MLRDWSVGKFARYAAPVKVQSGTTPTPEKWLAALYLKSDEAVLATLKTRKELRKTAGLGLVRFSPGTVDDRQVNIEDEWAVLDHVHEDSDEDEDDDGEFGMEVDGDSGSDEDVDEEDDDEEAEEADEHVRIETIFLYYVGCGGANKSRKPSKHALGQALRATSARGVSTGARAGSGGRTLAGGGRCEGSRCARASV